MLVHFATTDSKTRTKLNDIKIHSTFAGNPGPVLQSRHIRPPFIHLNCLIRGISLLTLAASVVRSLKNIHPTGKSALIILPIRTNLGSAMRRRSFIELIIFDNTSSIVMQVAVANGPTFWRTAVSAKKRLPNLQAYHQQPVRVCKVAAQVVCRQACQILPMHMWVQCKWTAKRKKKNDGRSRGLERWPGIHVYRLSTRTMLSNRVLAAHPAALMAVTPYCRLGSLQQEFALGCVTGTNRNT